MGNSTFVSYINSSGDAQENKDNSIKLDDERTDISGYLAGLVKDDLSETYSKLVVPLNPEDSESERHSYNFGDNPDDIQLAQQEQDDLDEIANFVEANSGAIDTEYVALINSLRDSEKSKISAENALKKTTDDYGTYTLTAGKLEDKKYQLEQQIKETTAKLRSNSAQFKTVDNAKNKYNSAKKETESAKKELEAAKKLVKELESSSTPSYYTKPKYTGASIVDALKSIGVDSSLSNRAKIAVANGIVTSTNNYTGTAAQNTKMLNLLKQGKLKKPGSSSTSSAKLADAKKKLTTAQNKVTKAEKAEKTAKDTFEKLKKANPDYDKYSTSELSKLEKELANVTKSLNDAHKKESSAKVTNNKANNDYVTSQIAYDTAKTELETKLAEDEASRYVVQQQLKEMAENEEQLAKEAAQIEREEYEEREKERKTAQETADKAKKDLDAANKALTTAKKTLETLKKGTSSTSSASYYSKPKYTGSSIVDALKSIGVDNSFSNRAKIAAANGIVSSASKYTGTAAQNTKMLNLLKSGKLKKPGSTTASKATKTQSDAIRKAEQAVKTAQNKVDSLQKKYNTAANTAKSKTQAASSAKSKSDKASEAYKNASTVNKNTAYATEILTKSIKINIDTLVDKINRNLGITNPTDTLKKSIDRYAKYYNRFKKADLSLMLRNGIPHVFFVRPSCNILDSNHKLLSALTGNKIFEYAYHSNEWILKELVANNGQGHDFMMLLSNFASSFSLTDEYIDNSTYGKTFTGNQIAYGQSNAHSKTAGTFEITFNDDKRLHIYQLHKIWCDYISGVYRGEIAPAVSSIKSKILDYTSAVYYIVTADDGETIIFWSKYYGVFPTTIPSNQYSWGSGNTINDTKLSITYSYSYKEDFNPYSIMEFNYNARCKDSNASYIPIYDEKRNAIGRTLVGAPFIEGDEQGGTAYNLKLRFRPTPNDTELYGATIEDKMKNKV